MEWKVKFDEKMVLQDLLVSKFKREMDDLDSIRKVFGNKIIEYIIEISQF